MVLFVLLSGATVTPQQQIVDEVVNHESVPLLDELPKVQVSVKNVAYAAEPKVALPEVSGNKQQWMSQAGIKASDYRYVDYIVQKESSWRYTAQNPTSSAYGLCQTMMSIHRPGGDFKSNPVTQLKWCNNYAVVRYGSWANAYNFWTANNWW